MSEKHTNRLIHEKSPYLLQHAHNPVDWYPWGDEAFEKARREDKPIFLSIGYATCHWCHVMERESFEDEATATYLNEHFVCIKVDREERPDVDMTYMAAVQAMTGHGGWPLSVFLTPDLKPFYGGTYFPKEPRYGMPSFMQVLREIHRAWEEQREDLIAYGNQLLAHLKDEARQGLVDYRPTPDLLRDAFQMCLETFDSTYGGFGGAPKFPRPMDVQFLLRYYRMANNPRALQMALLTLDRMAAGGIYDHLGGGFHRYATDRQWLVPHFEKMLYDNALLMMAYTEAFQVTGNEAYARTVRETAEYLRREMTSSEGGFFCAQDADSEGQEGKFYTWTQEEVRALLTDDEFAVVRSHFGLSAEGNFEHGRNILHVAEPLSTVARKLGISPTAAEYLLASAKKKLLAARQQRVPPLTDDKILTSWNGLAISALARAATVLGDATYLDICLRAARFLWQTQFRGDRLLHRYRDGQAAIEGFLEDYAFLAQAYLDLYEATFDLEWFEQAQRLADLALKKFYDLQRGGFYFTPASVEDVTRMKDSYDGAMPSGNSVMVLNLLRLAEYTGSDAYREKALETLGYFAERLEAAPMSFAQMLLGVDFLLAGPREIAIVTPEGRADEASPFLSALRAKFLPHKVVAVIPASDPTRWIRLFPWTEGRSLRDGRVTAYVCRNYVCQLPVVTVEEFLRQLD